jgi:CspA family cold shock protein
MTTEILIGKIKFFNENKGYGFIIGESGTDYFVHASGCTDKVLKKDELVTFKLENGEKGLKAVNVKRKK